MTAVEGYPEISLRKSVRSDLPSKAVAIGTGWRNRFSPHPDLLLEIMCRNQTAGGGVIAPHAGLLGEIVL